MGTGKLIKSKPSQKSEVWEFDGWFRKKWFFKDEDWLDGHDKKLSKVCPEGYLMGWGCSNNQMWLDTKKIEGQLASAYEHTPEFVSKITNFCFTQYQKTKPYAHFDWDLNNIIINGNDIHLVDWDNFDEYPEGQILDKMESDLKKAFGDQYKPEYLKECKVIENKTSATTEKLKFVIELYSEFWKNPPIAEVYINDQSKFKDYIKGTKDKPTIITFEQGVNEGSEYQLIIDRYNKSEKETNIVDGKILNDQMLHIKSITIDEIDIGSLVYEGVYKPKYPKRWAQQQKDAGNNLPNTLKNVTAMGHNGTWTFSFSSPFYMWLLENLY